MEISQIFILILLMPIVGGLAGLLFRKFHGLVSTASIALSFVLSLSIVLDSEIWLSRFEWLPAMELGWRLDKMSALLIALVLFISLLVHVFSLKYMDKKQHPRYFIKLGLFTFSMIGLLASDHLVLMFVFWELVGFSSYLLIGFWHDKDDASTSAKWAFMTNRVADVAFLIAVLSLGLDQGFFISELSPISSIWVGAGLLIGAMGKSAQLPFSAWLPRAMTGPTPVSALIHAATMVAAGVYLLIRVGPFLPLPILTAAAIVGTITALFGAMTAMSQHDIKQVLAYSTISQLGFMFIGIGVGAMDTAFFHLWTHAFFKAGLFLAAGAVIYHLGTQDMRQMGGLVKSMKMVMTVHIICGMSLAGIPLFSGFISKEGILQSTWAWAENMTALGYQEAFLIPFIAFFTIVLTAGYIVRQLCLVYFRRITSNELISSVPIHWAFGVPLILLGIGSISMVHNINPFGSTGWVVNLAGFTLAQYESNFLMYLSVALGMGGAGFSYYLYNSKSRLAIEYSDSEAPSTMIGGLAYHGWYLDDFYKNVLAPDFVQFSKWIYSIDLKIIDRAVNIMGVLGVVLAKILGLVDKYVIDGFVRFLSWISQIIGSLARSLQSGQIQKQLIWLLIGLILILSTILFF